MCQTRDLDTQNRGAFAFQSKSQNDTLNETHPAYWLSAEAVAVASGLEALAAASAKGCSAMSHKATTAQRPAASKLGTAGSWGKPIILFGAPSFGDKHVLKNGWAFFLRLFFLCFDLGFLLK